MDTRKKSLFFIEINSREGEKVKISPVGIGVRGLDGRTYDIDGKAVLEFQRQQALDIYVDENHRGGKAQGWIYLDTLELRADGIYANVDYTPEGQPLVDNKSYRYFSPSYIMGDNRQVLGIESVALCNAPNLLNKAINNKENIEMTPEEIKALIEEQMQALKTQLLEDLKKEVPAPAEEVEKAVEEVKAVAAEVEKAAEEVKGVAEEVKEAASEVVEANKQNRERRIDAAIASGEFEANKREFALSLNSKQFESFLAVSKNDNSHLKKPLEIEKNTKGAGDEVTKSINEQLGL